MSRTIRYRLLSLDGDAGERMVYYLRDTPDHSSTMLVEFEGSVRLPVALDAVDVADLPARYHASGALLTVGPTEIATGHTIAEAFDLLLDRVENAQQAAVSARA